MSRYYLQTSWHWCSVHEVCFVCERVFLCLMCASLDLWVPVHVWEHVSMHLWRSASEKRASMLVLVSAWMSGEKERKKKNNYCCCICILEPNGCCFHVKWSGLHNLAPCQPFWIWNSAAHFTGSSPCNFVCSLSVMITTSWHNSTRILFSWQSVFVAFIGGGVARTGISASTLHRKRRMLNGQNTMFIMQFLPYPVAVQVL